MGGIFDEAYDDGTDNDESSVGLIRHGVTDVRQQMRDTAAFMLWTNEDVKAAITAKKVSVDFLQAWLKTWDAWQTFYARFDGFTGAFMLHQDATYEKAIDYLRKGQQFRAALKEMKHPVTPTSKILEQKTPRDISFKPSLQFKPSMGFPWKWFLIGAGVAGAGYVGYRIFFKTPVGKTVTFAAGEEKKEITQEG
jgi:hypothetical protein